MSSCIFSTYSQGENRVTSTIMAVLRRLPLDHAERLISALLEQEFEMVRFQNQPSKGHDGVPDAKISGNFNLLIETKIKKNMINDPDQINRHLQGLSKSSVNQFLLVLTPDRSRPQVIEELINSDETKAMQLIWQPFTMLDQAANDLLKDDSEVVSERDTFLLKQLQIMMREESLLESDKEILVVAANRAWPEYNKIQAYVCQPGRSFQDVNYIAFYCDGEIKPIIPKIKASEDNIRLDPESKLAQFKTVITMLLNGKLREQGDINKIMLLSAPNDSETIKLPKPIGNDLKSETGRGIAFTQGHRYVSSTNIETASTTSELLKQST